ncbi:hypothetical protein ACTQ33_09295 [Candidatus Avoscillospira sp. LCP25S3_F1]|uniref:hypothetical protein n=1 Tax=Candidatus Avoscillospira sp. LCP25S3_F1 TaxID=3438825 RepID=UPI003F923ED0
MGKGEILLGIAAFAVVTAILYGWGLRRSMTQADDLRRILLSRGAGRVRRYLKQHDTVALQDMTRLVTGLRGGQPWSRHRITVSDPAAFARELADYMTEQRLLDKTPDGRYRLRH